VTRKQLEEDATEALMSARFEANKSKEWFEKQLDIKKAGLSAEESGAAMKRMIEAQEIMKNIEIDSSSFQITIIDNTPV